MPTESYQAIKDKGRVFHNILPMPHENEYEMKKVSTLSTNILNEKSVKLLPELEEREIELILNLIDLMFLGQDKGDQIPS